MLHIRRNDNDKYQVLDENDLVIRTLDTYTEAERFVEQATAHLRNKKG